MSDLVDFTVFTPVGQQANGCCQRRYSLQYMLVMAQVPHQATDYIHALNINGLHGRMLRAPASKKTAQREILLVYGHHALLERWWGLVENLQEYGSVTMPDLPGFGGMDSFAKIRRRPTIDNYADYLAAFIKMRYKKRPITIVGISFGFVVATRMLQRYPEMVGRVNFLVSIVGFMHRDDFLFKPRKRQLLSKATKTISVHPIAWLIRYLMLNKFVIRNIYARLGAGKRRFLEMDATNFDTLMDFEVRLWQSNDVRTHWLTTSEFLNIDNCTTGIDLPIWHVASSGDHYFNNDYVEQHMQVVFTGFSKGVMQSAAHTPSVLGNKQELAIMLPPKLRTALRKKP